MDMGQKKSNVLKIISIILFVLSGMFFMGMVTLLIVYRPISIDNTVEYTARIESINPIGIFSIKTDEFNAQVGIMYEDSVLDMSKINNLSEGQTITFRVNKGEIYRLQDEEELGFMVALSIEEGDIITIESYNEVISKMRLESSLSFASVGTILLIIAIVLFVVGHEKNEKKEQ